MTKHHAKPAVEVLELTRCYGELRACDHISFSVPQGTVFGLLGPNGAGKSTTLKMLTTLLPPTSGTARVCGHDIIMDQKRVRSSIGYVPQGLSADGDLTGYENLLLSAKLYAIDSSTREAKIQEILNFLGLSEFGNKLVNSYSGGMIRRLEIGQALLHEPPVLFLDEPTVGLDPAARIMIWSHIRAWQKKYKTTILMTTQDMQEADSECDLVAFMHRGEIVALDAPDALKIELGSDATLADVFIHHTGTSIQERGDFQHVRKIRRTLSRLG